jgi:hypothetical protein
MQEGAARRIFYTVEDLGQRCTNKVKQGPNTVVILKITLKSATFLEFFSNFIIIAFGIIS